MRTRKAQIFPASLGGATGTARIRATNGFFDKKPVLVFKTDTHRARFVVRVVRSRVAERSRRPDRDLRIATSGPPP